MTDREESDAEKTLAGAQLQKLELEIKKLKYDVESLGSKSDLLEKVIKFIPVMTILIAVAGFWLTVIQYNTQQTEARKQQAAMAEQYNAQQAATAAQQASDREQALLKPVWEKRLELYFTASETAATIALSNDKTERDKAEAKFMQLYAGPLVIVEDADVEGAMINFHSCLTGQDACDQPELQRRSLTLASKARDSIGKSFNVKLGDLKGKY